jgi:hypothetical protein
LNQQDLFPAKNLKPEMVITIQHQGMNSYGHYLFPQFFRRREDVLWEDLVDVVNKV